MICHILMLRTRVGNNFSTFRLSRDVDDFSCKRCYIEIALVSPTHITVPGPVTQSVASPIAEFDQSLHGPILS